ncbi:hypothetical protein AQUCO_01400180v1, partial [Aquilegia coerulea]
GDALVRGFVYYDQCKDGLIDTSDYPINGVEVKVACKWNVGKALVDVYTEAGVNTTSFGSYIARFLDDNFIGCKATLSGQGFNESHCQLYETEPSQARLISRLNDTSFYLVDSLLSHPAQPKTFCLPRSSPSPAPLQAPSMMPSEVCSFFDEVSVCSYEIWTRPWNKCNWKVVQPDTKVADAFGPYVASKYGIDMTLWEGLQGKGEVYRTLLREAIAALLNSYNNFQFEYPTSVIFHYMDLAIASNPQQALKTALQFKKANSGSCCGLTPCY